MTEEAGEKVTVELNLDNALVVRLNKIAHMAGCPIDTVIEVMLAAHIVRTWTSENATPD